MKIHKKCAKCGELKPASGIKIEQDVKVTPGEFWPPEGWEP